MPSRRTVPRTCQRCGTAFLAKPDQVRYGKAKYCGIVCQGSATADRKAIYGDEVLSPEFHAWRAIKNRCFSPLNKSYDHYGGRGITVCDAWRNDYRQFLEHVGRRPSPHHSIDRINNDGNYEPGNVRWATSAEQMRNRRVTRFLTLNGTTLCLSDWATQLGIGKTTLLYRIRAGWSDERTLTTPRLRP